MDGEQSVYQAIIFTVTTLVKAEFNSSQSHVSTTTIQSPSFQQTVIASTNEGQPSPGKAAEIRGKCLSQLSALKKLFDEQKKNLRSRKVIRIFRTLHKLN